ncbi:MAG: ABC transporter ATP-binding protein [Thermacetogeniaceae bacterium]
MELRDVVVQFGGVRAVSSLSFQLPWRGFMGLIGPNGAGKTTVFNAITGAVKPASGDILIDSKSLIGLEPHEIADSGIARTFQNIRLFPRMTVLENVALALHAKPRYPVWKAFLRPASVVKSDAQVEQEAHQCLAVFDLEPYADVRAGTLPYGLQRKVELARALARRPKVLLLDEPAAGMNDEESDQLADLLRRVHSEHEVSIILVEHHIDLVMKVCQSVTVLNLGAKLAEGTPEEIQRDLNVIKAYLGDRRVDHA